MGRRESMEMVRRYTRQVTFEDSLRFYKCLCVNPFLFLTQALRRMGMVASLEAVQYL